MKKLTYFLLTLFLVFNSACSDDEDDNNPKTSVCDGFFDDNNMTEDFTASLVSGDFSDDFTPANDYEVVISVNGDVEISSDADPFIYTESMITSCENEQETNVFYENPDNGNKLILQKENETYQLVISRDGATGQVTLDKFGPIDLSLLSDRAGTYSVSSMSNFASHDRMSVIINADGSIDFDTNEQYSQNDVDAIFDRLDCCDRIHVDIKDEGTMNFFWTSPSHTNLDSITFQGNTWYFN